MRESSVLSGPNYLELSALQKNRRYDIWVKAETSAGYGASSDITSIILGHTGIYERPLYRTLCSLQAFFAFAVAEAKRAVKNGMFPLRQMMPGD